MKLLADVNARGTTVLVATHDQGLLDRYQKRILKLQAGPRLRGPPVNVGYVGQRALLGMRQSPYGAAVATATIALALFAVGAVSAAGALASRALGTWGQELKLTVYLEDSATAEQRAAVQARLGADARFTSKVEALVDLRASLGQVGWFSTTCPRTPCAIRSPARQAPLGRWRSPLWPQNSVGCRASPTWTTAPSGSRPCSDCCASSGSPDSLSWGSWSSRPSCWSRTRSGWPCMPGATRLAS